MPGMDLGGVEGRVQDLSLLATGTADQHRMDALGMVAGHGARPLGRLVVGVGMNGQKAELIRHDASRYRAPRP